MTTEEHERLAKLEAIYTLLDISVQNIECKVDKLVAMANIGRGAFWMLIKAGGFIIALCGAIAWVFDHIGARP